MDGSPAILFWRRTDVIGLERMMLSIGAGMILAESTVVCMEDGGFRLDHHWRLSADWRVLSVDVEKWGEAGYARLALQRSDRGWTVDGIARSDLDGADEPDLSVTPFCNTFPIRRMVAEARQSLTIDTCYVDGTAMTVERSRQRYERLSQDRFRYIDLGLAAGFEAELHVDGQGLVLNYEHLFERVFP